MVKVLQVFIALVSLVFGAEVKAAGIALFSAKVHIILKVDGLAVSLASLLLNSSVRGIVKVIGLE